MPLDDIRHLVVLMLGKTVRSIICLGTPTHERILHQTEFQLMVASFSDWILPRTARLETEKPSVSHSALYRTGDQASRKRRKRRGAVTLYPPRDTPRAPGLRGSSAANEEDSQIVKQALRVLDQAERDRAANICRGQQGRVSTYGRSAASGPGSHELTTQTRSPAAPRKAPGTQDRTRT